MTVIFRHTVRDATLVLFFLVTGGGTLFFAGVVDDDGAVVADHDDGGHVGGAGPLNAAVTCSVDVSSR